METWRSWLGQVGEQAGSQDSVHVVRRRLITTGEELSFASEIWKASLIMMITMMMMMMMMVFL